MEHICSTMFILTTNLISYLDLGLFIKLDSSSSHILSFFWKKEKSTELKQTSDWNYQKLLQKEVLY